MMACSEAFTYLHCEKTDLMIKNEAFRETFTQYESHGKTQRKTNSV